MESMVRILGAFLDTLVLNVYPTDQDFEIEERRIDESLKEELLLLKGQAQELEEDVPTRFAFHGAPLLMRGYFEGEPKTARSRRTIVLPHFVIDVLKKHQASQMDLKLEKGSKWVDRGLVFCGKNGDYLLPQTLHYQFTHFLEYAGLPPMRFHDLRHSAVTLLLAMGVDPKSIQELVGHQSITTTLGVYGHLLLSMQMGIADKLDGFFNQEQS